MKSMHTFGCLMFASQNALASGNSIPQWDPRAHIGLNLLTSLLHARNVHLVLSLTTGLLCHLSSTVVFLNSLRHADMHLKMPAHFGSASEATCEVTGQIDEDREYDEHIGLKSA
jgi:hypothetical protein